ncbi:hypothetical protein Micbo1qcDRAFT_171014 [Microdochium bolleyi]|uniref:Rhodopsin domain-containing protein n=1 Tax=Microdochium bolleyi TaxID=196109 RepID=A0A136JJJ3_9PEZI|nr:hypothetical protein Micbo1qcDRAFT_171014 [Microdochium bolleyi]
MATPIQKPQALAPPRISRAELIATIWILQAFAILLVAARLCIRRRFSGRFYVDDYLAVAALTLLLVNSILQTIMSKPMFEMLYVASGSALPTADFAEITSFYITAQRVSTGTFMLCLWTVKACFLAFFYRLVSRLTWAKRAWIGICVFTGLSLIVSIILTSVVCSSVETAVNLISDFAIMLLPIYLTLGLQMSVRQKISLVAVLALGCIVAVFSVVRIAVTYTTTTLPELTWLALWSSTESSVAVMVACLPSFKVLVSQNRASRGSDGDRPLRDNSKYNETDSGGTHGSSLQDGARDRFTGHRKGSTSQILASLTRDDDEHTQKSGSTELQTMRRASSKAVKGDIQVTQTFSVSDAEKGVAREESGWAACRDSQERILK